MIFIFIECAKVIIALIMTIISFITAWKLIIFMLPRLFWIQKNVIIVLWASSWIWFRVSSKFIFQNLRLFSIFIDFILWLLIFNFLYIKMFLFQTQSLLHLSLQIQRLIVKWASISLKYTSCPLLAYQSVILLSLLLVLNINLFILSLYCIWMIFWVGLLLVNGFGRKPSFFEYYLWGMLFLTVYHNRLICLRIVLFQGWFVFEVDLASNYGWLPFFLKLVTFLIITIVMNKFNSYITPWNIL